MIAWVDVETSDFDEQAAHLLEVAIVISDDQLVELAATSVVIMPATCSVEGLVAQMPDVVRSMHAASGLLDELRAGRGVRLDVAERVLLQVLIDNVAVGAGEPTGRNSSGEPAYDVPLAGSTVGFDRRWLKRHLPSVEGLVSYRALDVSTITESAKRWAPDIYAGRPKKASAHRALADVRESIAYLSYYLDTGFLGERAQSSIPIGMEVAALERRRMWDALKFTGGNRTAAALFIGMPLRTFVTKVKVYGLARECPPSRSRRAVADAR